MEADRTILTDNSKIADAIRRSVPDKVMEVDARFIELSHPGFNSDFEPQFRVTNPEVARAVQGLVGQVVCALPLPSQALTGPASRLRTISCCTAWR